MSSKASIELTKDNEHIYEEVNDPKYKHGEFIGFTIVMEMNKKNIVIVTNDDEELIIEIKPGSELYDFILNRKKN